MSNKTLKKLPGWFPLPGSLMQNLVTHKTFVVIDLISPLILTQQSRRAGINFNDSTWKIRITDEDDQSQHHVLYLTRYIRDGWRIISCPPARK